ncbi:GNAT family N-acetyltransferase [Desulfobacterales bacterium HSG17]|nr:GNAT family N-acetyltransferase [Desulfobacterales bacterium HSG17]
MKIIEADIEDAQKILELQKLAYKQEAEIYQDFNIPPLLQTLEEIKKEIGQQIFLKTIDGNKIIIGSVRAYSDNDSCFIGRLIVHPKWQRQGIGTKLMHNIEACFPNIQRCELFTGTKSTQNIKLYKRLGYKPFKELVVNKSLSLVYMEKISKITNGVKK